MIIHATNSSCELLCEQEILENLVVSFLIRNRIPNLKTFKDIQVRNKLENKRRC